MYINKHHIDDYIKCPYLFALSVLKEVSEKETRTSQVLEKLSKARGTSKVQLAARQKKSIINIKNHIAEIASYEMKNDDKLDATGYRTKYTNKFFSKASDVLDEKLVPKLNKILEVFSANAFIGYNLPIDIPIQGTAIMYRDIVDFILTDADSNIIIVEFVDLTNIDQFRRKINYWPHYRVPYSFLAASFDKDVEVVWIDPDDFVSCRMAIKADQLDKDTNELASLVFPMQESCLTRNLYACSICDYRSSCE